MSMPILVVSLRQVHWREAKQIEDEVKGIAELLSEDAILQESPGGCRYRG